MHIVFVNEACFGPLINYFLPECVGRQAGDPVEVLDEMRLVIKVSQVSQLLSYVAIPGASCHRSGNFLHIDNGCLCPLAW